MHWFLYSGQMMRGVLTKKGQLESRCKGAVQKVISLTRARKDTEKCGVHKSRSCNEIRILNSYSALRGF